jgi:hypothetical protein
MTGRDVSHHGTLLDSEPFCPHAHPHEQFQHSDAHLPSVGGSRPLCCDDLSGLLSLVSLA